MTLILPALAEPGDSFDREPVEALWTAWYPATAYPSVENGELSTRQFVALYQQRPSPAEGAMFKAEWLHISTAACRHENLRAARFIHRLLVPEIPSEPNVRIRTIDTAERQTEFQWKGSAARSSTRCGKSRESGAPDERGSRRRRSRDARSRNHGAI